MKKEIAIALFDSYGGVEEGDIIVCREPSLGIGNKESKGFLWFRADISEELANILASSGDTYKWRFNIPLSSIAEIDESFNIDDARDMDTEYQPFLPLGDDMLFTDPDPDTMALENMSIVWDKSTEEFI